MSPPMNTLHTFRLVAQLLNMSKAGQQLGLTHSAVSGQIKRLEAWFGRRLFRKAGRNIELTPVGAELLSMLDTTLPVIDEVSQRLRRSDVSKSVAISCLPSVAVRWLVPALPEFMKMRSDVTLQISYSQPGQTFDADKHDILITVYDDTLPDPKALKLFSRRTMLVASQQYFINKISTKESPLDGVTVLHDETKEAWNTWVKKYSSELVKVKNGPIFEDFNMFASAVIAGHGVGLCPVEIFSREIKSGELVIFSDVSIFSEKFYMLTTGSHPSRAVSAFVRWFTDHCVEAARLDAPPAHVAEP